MYEAYPSLFDGAKVQNNFEKTKQSSDFNIPLTFGGCVSCYM
nr:MAG TPA: hypothetical protein [Ackermannviridae sp.]